MLLSFINKINSLNDYIFSPLDNIIENLPFEEWILDAVIDSIHLLPFLFVIFVIIEILEFYFSDKIDYYVKKSRKSCVAVGAVASIMPQCGFSVIFSSLYSKRLVSRGCIIAVYLGTSDETIPILLASPSNANLILPIVGLKLLIAVFAGYVIDLLFTKHLFPTKRVIEQIDVNETYEEIKETVSEGGCCNHNPVTKNKRELVLHPLMHTINIFAFILVITLILNYVFEHVSVMNCITENSSNIFQCVVASFIGLIPNCAISIGITMMLMKGTISFGAAMSGLLANGGLGLLVLLKNNNFKDTFVLILILLSISIVSGFLINVII